MKYQLKVIFKKILNNMDLIKKFINLKPEEIYKFSKEIYLSEDISKHLEFINEEEFWQEIFSMITGKEIHELEDLAQVAGGKISLKKSFAPALLSFLTVGGSLLPGSDYVLTPVVNAEKFKVSSIEVEIEEPATSPAVINTINQNPTLKEMFGFDVNAHVTTLKPQNIDRYKKCRPNPAGADEAASCFLVLVHALPMIARKFSHGTDLSMDGLINIFKDDKEKYSLTNFIGKLKADATSNSSGLSGWVADTARAGVLSALPGNNWGTYSQSTEKDLASVQLLIAYYEDYVYKTKMQNFDRHTKLKSAVNDFFGAFYMDPQRQTKIIASEYVKQVLSKYIAPLQTLTQDATTDLLNAFKQTFPILNTVSDTFDKVKGITANIQNLTDKDNSDGIPAAIGKVKNLVSKLTDWQYPREKLEEIKKLIGEIGSSSDHDEILTKLQELKKISDERERNLLPGTPVQTELDRKLTDLCNYINLFEHVKKQTQLNELGGNNSGKQDWIKNVKRVAGELKLFIENAESSKSDLEKLLSNGKDLLGDVRKKLETLDKTGLLSAVGLQKDYEDLKQEVFGKFDALKAEAFGKLDEKWNELNSEGGLLKKGAQIAENVKNITGAVKEKSGDIKEIIDDVKNVTGKVNEHSEDIKEIIGNVKHITGFLSSPWLAAGVLGAGGAALLEGTTGVLSELFEGTFHKATSGFNKFRRFYNETIYNNLFLEKDPLKLKKLVSEYLKSTLMFPGQASEKIAEVLSVNKLSGQVPAMLELSGNVCSEVFSEIHRSMFERNFDTTWQKIDVAQQKPQVISRTISDGSKEKITLSLADTIFNTTNSSMRKLKNNTGTTLVFENLDDQSVIDRLEEARKTGILSLYNNKTGEHEELDVSKTVILISNKRKDNKVILENSEHIKFEDFTEEEYAYILADKLSDKGDKYYKKYETTVEFSDDFIKHISKKAVKDHAGYNDAEKYIKNIDSALLSFLSQDIETDNLQLECYIDRNDQFMFKEKEIIIEKTNNSETANEAVSKIEDINKNKH